MSINTMRLLCGEFKSVMVPNLRALIADDEPIARRVLREELELMDSVEVVGEADNGEAALLKISSIKPDVVFLDVQMPVMNGFELLDHLTGAQLPAIVMVTAYDQHAIRAFEAGAVDYLLKPISQQRLAQALERAKRIARNPVQLPRIWFIYRNSQPRLPIRDRSYGRSWAGFETNIFSWRPMKSRPFRQRAIRPGSLQVSSVT